MVADRPSAPQGRYNAPGKPSCRLIVVTTAPPLAVPSSLVTSPVRPICSPKAFACRIAFCPAVASSTKSVSCGAPGKAFSMTRPTFSSSRIRSSLLCKRPAVSIKRISDCRAFAAFTASNATAAASAPVCCRIQSTPNRSAQMASCSQAAARKVSPAANRRIFLGR